MILTRTQRNRLDKLWRQAIRKKAGGKCEICGAVDKKLEAHHIFGRASKSTRFEIDNGVLLCFMHHYQYAEAKPLLFIEWLRSTRGQEFLDRLAEKERACSKTFDWDKIEAELKVYVEA